MSGSGRIIPITEETREQANVFLREQWYSTEMVIRGEVIDLAGKPGFLWMEDREPLGLVTCEIREDECEILSLDSLSEGRGIGSALIRRVLELAREAGCRRVRLITTNDNLHALGFYQRRGFHLCALYPDALRETRRLKPAVPEIGENGIPLRDEIELEYPLK